MPKIIDLSKEIKYNKEDPFFMRVKIKHKSHKVSNLLVKYFVGLPQRLFPKRFEGWADDTIKHMGVHATTHIDAPWHYAPTVNGEPAKTIDQMPLDLCYGDGIVIDMSNKKELEPILKEDIEKFIEDNNLEIKSGNIVLIRTGRDKYIGTKSYAEMGAGMTREATEYLIDLGVKVMGIDQWGWDLPLKYQAKLAKENNDSEYFWNGHMIGAEKEYYHMEQLVNLGSLPLKGFKVAVFPLKIMGASAAPARVVAIFE